ncbi:VacJ family lipoprotein [Shewanella polaris]|uniref:VacJ family lipoprotein n=1 Tax=Shewanella polaris TaxID=2588449 RepID=A0A4Y5YJX9_9GAMM|nr:VacJ family lipoprotein [Shewanella polaris]QDE32793.1 VacJ family lipoprotein [Shewanella polaris]
MNITGRLLIIVATLLCFSGCASTSTPGDPFESANRKSWDFNYKIMDKHVVKPAAKGYEKIPQPVRKGVSNLLSNLSEPLYAVNNLLQWKVTDSGSSILRFVVNSTIGLVGIFDPATDMGLLQKQETFAQTFGAWGVGNGPFVMWPVYGASTARNTVGDFVDVFVYPLSLLTFEQRLGKFTLEGLDSRIEFQQYEPMLNGSLDPYGYVKDVYLQRDAYLVSDGKVKKTEADTFDEEFDNELLDDELLDDELIDAEPLDAEPLDDQTLDVKPLSDKKSDNKKIDNKTDIKRTD